MIKIVGELLLVLLGNSEFRIRLLFLLTPFNFVFCPQKVARELRTEGKGQGYLETQNFILGFNYYSVVWNVFLNQ